MKLKNLSSIARRLIESYASAPPLTIKAEHELPSRARVAELLSELRELIFPGSTGGVQSIGDAALADVETRVDRMRAVLREQVFRGLHHRCVQAGGECTLCADKATKISEALCESLPDLRALLLSDVVAAYEGDPAATGTDEVVFSYPGIQAIFAYRLAHRLLELDAPIVPRMITELAHAETGIDIHPGATIGPSFFIDHGTGVVIGETTVIGTRVRLYQGVTLGALSVPTGAARQLSRQKRHPTLEDDVIIYANATILGGDTVIGRAAVIGGNSWIISSVPSRM